METSVFRLAEVIDLDLVSSISRRAYEPAYLELIGALPRPAIEDYRPWIADALVWIYELNQIPIGVVVFEEHADFWMLWSLAVDPDYQGRGIGFTLLKHAKEIARSQGVSCLRLHTNSKMTGNLALYKKAGFKQFAVIPHPRREGHQLVYLEHQL
ncbi:GNAT family N-acetyltransferase [Thioclava sp. BHET1]|nr:GNAT family N-acetyltransferase [Thioclava sp. BHET1]